MVDNARLNPDTAAMLKKYRGIIDEINRERQFTGYAPQPEQETVDPRIMAGKMNVCLDNIVKPMQRIETIVERVSKLEVISLSLFVALAEALESGQSSTPYQRARPVTKLDIQNWNVALERYRRFIEEIDV